LIVSPSRFDKAQQIFTTQAAALGVFPLIDILIELNLDEHVSFNSVGKMEFDLTPLQWVAFAAAIVAVGETGVEREASPEWEELV
jgi:hypothetical protein